MQLQRFLERQRLTSLTVLTLLSILAFTGLASAQAGPVPDGSAQPASQKTIGIADSSDRLVRHAGGLAALNVSGSFRRASSAAPSIPVSVPDQLNQPAQPTELDAFAASVSDGKSGVLRGVYVPGVLALRVVQQPSPASFHVDRTPGVATQFGAAGAYGVTGLLADNVASGSLYFSLSPGQVVSLIYGDGTIRHYHIDSVYRYQALSPNDPFSDFLDLASGSTLSATSLFSLMYTGGDKVTFQTCIAQDGVFTWGRLFVTARPAS